MKHASFILITLLFVLFADSQSNIPLWKTMPDPPPMPKADDSGFASVNNIKMYYAVFSKGKKNPVILLHGGFISSGYWSNEVMMLAKTHEVIVADSRGHGKSTMSDEPFTYNLMASDVLQLLDFLNKKNVSVVGWSDGGIVGLILAFQHPERINKLLTFGTNFNISGYSSEPTDTAMAARFMAKAQANYMMLSSTPDSFPKLKKALGKMYSIEPDLLPTDLQKIKCPTVIAAGEYDQFIKREHFEELARLIPHAKLVIIPNVSHGGPLQNTVSFHKAVAALLD